MTNSAIWRLWSITSLDGWKQYFCAKSPLYLMQTRLRLIEYPVMVHLPLFFQAGDLNSRPACGKKCGNFRRWLLWHYCFSSSGWSIKQTFQLFSYSCYSITSMLVVNLRIWISCQVLNNRGRLIYQLKVVLFWKWAICEDSEVFDAVSNSILRQCLHFWFSMTTSYPICFNYCSSFIFEPVIISKRTLFHHMSWIKVFKDREIP